MSYWYFKCFLSYSPTLTLITAALNLRVVLNKLINRFIDYSNMGSLKLIFWPLWIAENPYQKLLIEQLEKLGVQMGEENTRTILLIGQQKPDILHLHWLHPYFQASNQLISLFNVVKFISKLALLRLAGIKIVWTAHNLKNHESLNPLSDKLCTTLVVRLCHAIIAHCESAKDEVITNFYLKNKDKIFVIPHGNYIDFYQNSISKAEARKELQISESTLLLLFLGGIRPYKGVPEMIESFKQLRQDGLQLLIAGKPLNKEFGELVQQKIAGQDNIKLIADFIPEAQVQVFMNACDVAVFPYRDILTSGAVVLAMSFGRACIAPRKSCMGEVLDRSGAFLYDPDVESGLLQAMSSAINMKADLVDMGKHNRQLAEQYSWERIAKMTLDVYQWCLSC